MLKKINFLDDEFFRIIALKSRTVTQNDVIFSYNTSAFGFRLEDQSRTQYIYCDGEVTQLSKGETLKIEREYDKCIEGVAVDSFAFTNLESLAMYKASVSLPIPLSPLALSSLTATFIVYYLLISRLAVKYVRFAFVRFFEKGDTLMYKYLFRVTLLVAIVFLSPFVFLVRMVTD